MTLTRLIVKTKNLHEAKVSLEFYNTCNTSANILENIDAHGRELWLRDCIVFMLALKEQC